VLSRSRVSIIHPANSKALLSPGPPTVVLLSMPDHPGGVVLIKKIEDLTALRLQLVGFKPSSKCGLALCMGIEHILYSALTIGIEDNSLPVFQVDLKAYDIGELLLHRKEVEVPHSFTAANIACIQVLLHLILAPAKLHGSAIMPLVHILVDVLDCLDRCNRLHIDMAPILPEKIGRVAHHPLVIDSDIMPSHLELV